MSRLVPLVCIGRWGGDGLHWDAERGGEVEGWSLEFAWLGLHVEFLIAVERRS